MQNDSEAELDECDSSLRRKSIVYETPQINLSISELKLNYETKVEQEATTTTLDEANKTSSKGSEENSDNDNESDKEADNDDMPIRGTSARNENEKDSGVERARNEGLPADDEEQPTTSTKALSVFGEVRSLQVAPAAAGAIQGAGGARGGLTTLEHVLVACTVGLITPNDLLTLCLIVIGVIIIVAIALT